MGIDLNPRAGYTASGFAFLVMAFFFFLFGNAAIGIAFLALGVVFVINGNVRRPRTESSASK